MATKWDLKNWDKRPVTFFEALGLPSAKIKWPELKPTFSEQYAKAKAPSSSSGGSSGGPAPNVKGGTYTYGQLKELWISAGGKANAANMAAAIAMAESGGDVKATDHDSNGTEDRGLWQINSVHGSQSTYDPLGNARAAVAISGNGSNWSPWVTFQTGAYKKFLQ